MGELTTHFSDEFKAEHPTEIDWRNFKQLRNVCAHRYGTLDYKTIWDIAVGELPGVKAFFEKVIKQSKPPAKLVVLIFIGQDT